MDRPISPGWLLVGFGGVLVLAGLVWLVLPSIPWLGRLPGDIRIERRGFGFYFPVVTCLVVSVVLSAVLWLVGWMSGR